MSGITINLSKLLSLIWSATHLGSNLIQNWRLISLSTSSSPRIFLEKRFNFPLAISHPFYCSIESSGEPPPFCYCRSWLHSSQLFVGNSEHIIGNDLWSKASVKSEFGVLDKVASRGAQLCDSEKKRKRVSFVAVSFHSMITGLIDRVPKGAALSIRK